MDVGVRIRETRKAQKLTQAEVAQKAGIAINSLRLYEAGKRQPRLEQLRRIALALGTAVSELVGPEYWSTLSPEERVDMWKSAPPPQIPAQARITTALSKLNDAGMEKAADAVEVIAEVPRYQRSPAPEGRDTTPPEKPTEGPQEGE